MKRYCCDDNGDDDDDGIGYLLCVGYLLTRGLVLAKVWDRDHGLFLWTYSVVDWFRTYHYPICGWNGIRRGS